MQLAAHGRAEDHAGAIGVQWSVGIAVVRQRLSGDSDCPLLTLVHGSGHPRRNAKALPVEFEALHPAADLAVRLVRRSGIRIVIVVQSPAVRWNVVDAVAFVLDIVPKSRRVGGIWQDGSYTNDGNGSVGCVIHVSNSLGGRKGNEGNEGNEVKKVGSFFSLISFFSFFLTPPETPHSAFAPQSPCLRSNRLAPGRCRAG